MGGRIERPCDPREEEIIVARDYIVRKDQEFNAWLANFITSLSAHSAEFGLVPEDLLPIEGESTAFDSALTLLEQRRIALNSASKNKMSRRVSTEAVLRPLVRRITGHPAMTDGLLGQLGLPVRRVRKGILPVGPEVPAILTEAAPGRVIIHFGTAPANEQRNGKPGWAKGCNIYRSKAGESDFRMVGFASASPYVDEVVGAGSDYTYYVQYRGTKATQLGQGSHQMTVAARGLEAA